MKITTEQYNTLKLLADDIATARAAPKDMERFHKIVVQDAGKDKVVNKFSPEMTRAAILIALVSAVENDLDYTLIFMVPVGNKKPVEDQSQEPDVFTAEALAKIPPGKPDAGTLAPPKSGFTAVDPPKEGDVFVDGKGRHWKIVDGKKRQQKKPKPAKP